MGQAGHRIARHRGVGGDHAGHAVVPQRGGDQLDLGVIQVGRDLDEQRHIATGLAAVLLRQLGLAVLQGAQQRVQCRIALQRAQVLGVGAADVDGDVVGKRVHAVQPQQVVAGCVGDGRAGVFADVQADDAARSAKGMGPLDVGHKACQARVVKAQAVDQRIFLRQAEHARLRVAGLGPRRDGAHLDKAEAHGAQAIDAPAVFVQPRRQADAVGKAQARHRHRIVHPGLLPQALQRRALKGGDGIHRQVVGPLGVKPEQEGAGQRVGDKSHNSRLSPRR